MRRAMLLTTGLLLAGCAQPDLLELRRQHASGEIELLRQRSTTLSEPLTIDRAISLALENNLDFQLARFEQAIQEEAASGATLDMLPGLVNGYEYEWTSESRIASSQAADTGRRSLEPSFSSERDSNTYGFELVWSVLDFGISYFRAREAGNQARIYEERARRTEQKLILDVTRTYYRAVVATAATRESQGLVQRLSERQAQIDEQIRQQLVSELEGLSNREAIALTRIRLQAFQRELRKAKSELAVLLGLAPGVDFEFAAVDLEAPPERMGLDQAALTTEALHKRPEMWQEDLQELIAMDEVRARIVALFPNPAGFFGGHYDDNKFLRHQFWLAAGARVSWDLLSLPKKFSDLDKAELTVDLVQQRRMAVAMGIVAQVHLAVIDYDDALQQFELARNLTAVREQKVAASRRFEAQGQVGPAQVLEAETDAVFARLRYLDAYAELVVAGERIKNSVGRGGPPRYSEIDDWASSPR